MIELTQEELKQRFSDKIFGQISETADFENDVPHSSSVIRAIFRVETPSRTMVVMVVRRACSLRE